MLNHNNALNLESDFFANIINLNTIETATFLPPRLNPIEKCTFSAQSISITIYNYLFVPRLLTMQFKLCFAIT